MKSLPRRVTLKELAARLGIHHTSVSRALRGHPRISEAMTARVRKLAAELGYEPDPYLTGLAAYRQGQGDSKFAGVLAWVTNWRTREGWRTWQPILTTATYFGGAEKRAAELGYRLEEFWLGDHGTDMNRGLRILRARGIQGLLFAPQPDPHTRLEVDLSWFSAVSFGLTLESPALHVVTSHSYRTMIGTLEKLRELGYRRPGLATTYFHEERINRAWTAAFWAYQAERGKRRVVPPLVMPDLDRKLFEAWLQKQRPDVVMASNSMVTRGWLEAGGRRIPDDIGLVPTIISDNSFLSGMNENGPVIGAAAVDLLVSMLHRNERGVPTHPQRVLIEGSWVDGKSVRRQR
ncbi:transcriptional regulator [Opitutaceae bacterium TAV1]|nr:transcriptional regulator [Opitutaceae bacterium TAV1]